MFGDNEFDKKISVKFLQTLNKHLPAKRKTLKELLSEDRPIVRNRDGTTHCFDKKELENLASMIPEFEHAALRLPLYLEMSLSMERGAIKISGRLECRIIKKILYEEPGKQAKEADSIVIYYPHLMKIRKELPTATQFMFTM